MLLLAGCEKDMRDLEQFVTETKQKHRGFVKPLPEFEPYRSFTYTPEKLRDPFVVEQSIQQAIAQNTGPRPDANRRKEPLEAFPMDSLKMVGVLEQKANLWALVRDPDGTIHRVQKGNYMGENDGRITLISESKIEVRELVKDGLGQWMAREASLGLSDE
jgi:type IV pilus assembly protein PilP